MSIDKKIVIGASVLTAVIVAGFTLSQGEVKFGNKNKVTVVHKIDLDEDSKPKEEKKAEQAKLNTEDTKKADDKVDAKKADDNVDTKDKADTKKEESNTSNKNKNNSDNEKNSNDDDRPTTTKTNRTRTNSNNNVVTKTSRNTNRDIDRDNN